MSDEQVVSNEAVDQTANESTQEQDEYVSRKVAEDYKNDMFKYKDRLKAERAAKAELELKLKSIEEQELKEKEDYKTLLERIQQERDEALTQAQQQQESTIRFQKQLALKNELGNIKDEYLVHADLNGIEINEDGTLSSESVEAVANSFREQHPGLLPKSPATGSTDIAAKAGGHVSYIEELKTASTQKELDAIRKKWGRA